MHVCTYHMYMYLRAAIKSLHTHYCFCTPSRVRETVIEVEYPLVESQLKELDEQLEKAINQLNWTSEGIPMFIQQPTMLHVNFKA